VTLANARGARLARTILVLMLSLVALTGCGDDNSGKATLSKRPAPLSAGDQATVSEARTEIQSYCRQLLQYLARRRGPPTEDETGEAYAGVDRLAGIARAQPSATVSPTGETVRDLLGDIAEDLQGSNCADNVVARIDQALRTLPAE
jgi:hypothetical protein